MGTSYSRTISRAGAGRSARATLFVGASALAIGAFAAPAWAQDNAGEDPAAGAQATGQSGASATPQEAETPPNEIVVTGIRASLERSIAIKRNSSGVVDAIAAEDIGKFPDANLAESLQRITGVAIDRTNGEGSLVTVRGFGPQYNLVTLNGRTLASSNVGVVGGDENADFAQGASRSFDFSNLASEGVRTLEVYKTGRAAIPSGGIGATINIVSRKPLDTGDTGLTGSIGAKAVYDTSVDGCLDCGSHITPEVSGVLSWADPSDTFGIGLFGSYQKRNFTSVSATSNAWNIQPYSEFLTGGFVEDDGSTVIENAPSDPDTLVAVPNDSRYHYAEGSRERINGQLVLQYRPSDSLLLTADALYAEQSQDEVRSDHSNWFSRPFDQVTFGGNDIVPTTVYLHETLNGVKDEGFEMQHRAEKNRLQDYGLNAQYELTDNFSVNVDGHFSKSTSRPDNPNGVSSTLVGLAANVVHAHSVDYSGDIPIQDVEFGSNPLSLDTLGSQIARTVASAQEQKVKEVRADFGWDLGEGSRFDFGGEYRDSNMHQTRVQTQQTLGDWGIVNPGDVEALAPGATQTFCLVCKFDDFGPVPDPESQTAFRADASELYSILSPYYTDQGNAIGQTSNEDNRVKEKIWAAYGQVTWDGQIAGRDANLVAGVRYEHTKTTSTSLITVPQSITWVSDNDFTVVLSGESNPLTATGSYDNILPSIDFRIEPAENLVTRFSFSKTIARPGYANLFSSTTVGGPPRPTYNGGVPTANRGNANLDPLSSDNFDVSAEYYFKPDSYISLGFFDKRVHNFVGTGQVTNSLFGLRDPSSGEAGSQSGEAVGALQNLGATVSDANLFVMTTLINQLGSVDAAVAEYTDPSHYDPATHELDADYVNNDINSRPGYDLPGNQDDPLYNFQISQPINNQDAEIYGFELAGQYFFGNTGIGVAAAYTLVRGDIGFDIDASPDEDQFALLGLSDTFNATLIYDKNGISARLAYNWRDKYLSALNRGADRNPVFTAPFGQLDLNISYDISPHIAVTFEGINLTEENLRTYGRDETQLFYAQELDRRFRFGARYRF
ncbi:TonB-dependent receptor [Stakelama saccharophila]|uniref:TonB-dependent receptor n=1 Tax=Stakelama saccharophila TaxID=3075605 RepID=A0ABZ0B9G2_9SPHN|nr:TonB-dependent receptor [Stakelama sp. W311]WNO54029.1 TonB-dependent receptor [Stakelama sp. W311]